MTATLNKISKVVESTYVKVLDSDIYQEFDLIASLIESAKFEEATSLIETQFEEEKACDIRVAIYYMYVYFRSEGLKSLIEILPLIEYLITSHWEVLSPVTKKNQHAEKSIYWFAARLIKSFKQIQINYKNNDDSALTELTKGLNLELREKLLTILATFKNTISEKWEESNLVNQTRTLEKWVGDLFQMAKPSPTPEIEEAVTSEKPAEEKSKISKQKKSNPPTTHDKIPRETEPVTQEENQSIPETPTKHNQLPTHLSKPSAQLLLLFKKLEAFQKLVKEANFQKASIVAEDIDKKIENFDPLEYFPKIFVEYYSLYAKHSTEISDGLAGNHPTLLKLYNADLDSFLEW